MPRVLCLPVDISRAIDRLDFPISTMSFFDFACNSYGATLCLAVRQAAESEAEARQMNVYEYALRQFTGYVIAADDDDVRSRFDVVMTMTS